MSWPKLLFATATAAVGTAAVCFEIHRAGRTIEHGLIHSGIIANFSRFGDIDPDKLVVIDDSHAYFMRDGALWTCDVKDDYLLRDTVRVVDVMNIQGPELKEVMAAVDALNMTEPDDDDDEGTSV